MIKNYLNKLRETKFWYLFLKFLFLPIFNFFWIYLINFQGKILKIFFKKNLENNNKDFFLHNNDKKILRNIPEFKKIIHEIDSDLNNSFLYEMKKKISSINYKEGHYLFNGKNFDGLYLKLRSGDAEMAKKVFAIENETIHVFNDEFPEEYNLNTGANDTHGLFYTKKKYSKYLGHRYLFN